MNRLLKLLLKVLLGIVAVPPLVILSACFPFFYVFAFLGELVCRGFNEFFKQGDK